MRGPLLALVILVPACSEDPVDIHALGACDQSWKDNGFTACETACQAALPALTASGPSCQARTSTGPVSCSKTLVFESVTGCCATSSTTSQVLFAECD